MNEFNVGDIIQVNGSSVKQKILGKIGENLYALSADGYLNWYNSILSLTQLLTSKYAVIIPAPWKPEKGDSYYFADTDGSVGDTTFEGTKADEYRKSVGNCFKYKDGVKVYIERLKTL